MIDTGFDPKTECAAIPLGASCPAAAEGLPCWAGPWGNRRPMPDVCRAYARDPERMRATILAQSRKGPSRPPGRDVRVPTADVALVVRGVVGYDIGYGRLTVALVREFERMGVKVCILPVNPDYSLEGDDGLVAERIVDDPGVLPVFQVTPPGFAPIPGAPSVILTMWETDLLPEGNAGNLTRFSRVIVPSAWQARTFAAQGIPPHLIRIVPLGIDVDDGYYPRVPPPSDPVVFGCAARRFHGGVRKGLEDAIIAFRAAFPRSRRVRLRLKLHAGCRRQLRIPIPDDPRIEVIERSLTDREMVEWYEGITYFFSMTRAEGWGLHHLEAMSKGRIQVIPISSGLTEFVPPHLSYPIEFDEQPAFSEPYGPANDGIDRGFDYAGVGRWYVPRMDSAVRQLRRAYVDARRGRHLDRAAAVAYHAMEYSWTRCAQACLECLKECGMVRPPLRPAGIDPRPGPGPRTPTGRPDRLPEPTRATVMHVPSGGATPGQKARAVRMLTPEQKARADACGARVTRTSCCGESSFCQDHHKFTDLGTCALCVLEGRDRAARAERALTP